MYNGYRIAQHRTILNASINIVGIPPFTRAHPSMCLVSYDFYYDLLIIIIIYSQIDRYINRRATLILESLRKISSHIFFRVFNRDSCIYIFIVFLYTLKNKCCRSIPQPIAKPLPKYSYAFHTKISHRLGTPKYVLP